MKDNGVGFLAVARVAPVFVLDAFEGVGPVGGQPDAPQPYGDQEEEVGCVETDDAYPESEHDGRRDAPVGVVDGDVLKNDSTEPYEDGGHHVGNKKREQGTGRGTLKPSED